MLNPDGDEVPGTRLKVAGELPVLFGYRPYQDGIGYELFGDLPDDDLGSDRIFRHNQIFPAAAFADLLKGLRSAAADADNLQAKPAIVKQEMAVIGNDWFGVAARPTVTILWLYLNDASQWREQLVKETASRVASIDDFPNYSTARTELDHVAVNAMSSFTAWCVANPESRHLVLDLFRPPGDA